MEIKLNPKEVEKHLLTYLKNSESLIAKNGRPTALCIEGPAGISKTSIVKQIAQKTGYRIHQINTAMIDDLGHLVGFPEKEFLFKENDGEYKWVPAEFSDDAAKTGVFTGQSRMAYAVPYWLKDINPDEKFMLLLDDFTRSIPMVNQAIMTLIEEYRYGSWELPKNTVIILTSNPDNGEYTVTSMDLAQKTRMRFLKMEFHPESWAIWAEGNGIDNRCINFVLQNGELFETKKDGIGQGKDYNARSMTKFFQDIGELDDFSTPENLSYIRICGQGCVGEHFSGMFTTFIQNKLDKLPNPKDLIFGKLENSISLLMDICGDYTKDKYHQATASVVAKRLVNFAIYGNHEKWGKEENNTFIELMKLNCFAEDLKLYMARQLASTEAEKHNDKLYLIVAHKEIATRIMS